MKRTCRKQQKDISNNQDKENKMKFSFHLYLSLKRNSYLDQKKKKNFLSDKNKDIERTLEENVTNLDNNV